MVCRLQGAARWAAVLITFSYIVYEVSASTLELNRDVAIKQLDVSLNGPVSDIRPFDVDLTVFQRSEPASYIPAIAREERIPNRYIVVMEDATHLTELATVIRALRFGAARGGPALSIDRLYTDVAVGFAAELSNDAVNLVRNAKGVAYIEEDILFTKQQDPLPWGLDRVDQPSLPLDHHFTAPGQGSGVDVYVVDTGIRYSHKEFTGTAATPRASWSGYDAFNDNGNNGADCDGHGTHVAGIIGGKKSGVAKGANLVSVRVLDCVGQGKASDVVAGLNWISDKLKNTNKKAVVGMSLAGKFSKTVNAAAKQLVSEGAVVVAAAGNYKKDACNFTPASEPEVITVGGTKNDDTIYDFQGYGSNFGGCVDIFAPGQQIRSSSNQCDDCYSELSGTSQAAPHVVGAAAIMLQKHPTYTPAEVRSTLIQLASQDKLDFGRIPDVAKPLTPNKLLYMPSVSNLAVSTDPFCRTVWSPLSDWLAGATTQVSCSEGETMTSCSSLANDNNRAGEYIENENGVSACKAVNGDGSGLGVYAVARCCLWPGMTCYSETSQVSSTRNNARIHTRCRSRQGYILAGCSAYTTGHIIGGARPATNRISLFVSLPFHTCIGQNSPGGVGVRAQATCCKATNLDCKAVWSPVSAISRGSMTHAVCESGWHLTGCNSYTWGGNASGAQSFGNKCFARNGMDHEGTYAVAICCKS
ncbi:extracellular serine proteinase-like [Ptychodera flava]|uniref:extracellular serine proteinase-like n=1 Tax=Ptychodera flava TaxID=63121 RepID=UPI003969E247